jgi:hypothetical protein
MTPSRDEREDREIATGAILQKRRHVVSVAEPTHLQVYAVREAARCVWAPLR